MRFRFWPHSLIGQLVLAVAVTLFIAQAINFGLLARGQQQQQLAHGGGMAAARIIDAVDRQRRGLPVAMMKHREERGSGRRARVTTSLQPMEIQAGAKPATDLANYVANLLDEADLSPMEVKAVLLPTRPQPDAQARRMSWQRVAVQARIDGRYYAVRGRIPGTNSRIHGFLIWQTLSLYILLLVPLLIIAWRASRPLRDLTVAARSDPSNRMADPIAERGPSDVRELIAAFNSFRSRITTMLSDKDRMLGAVGHDLRTPLASLRVRVEQVADDRLREKMIASIEEMTAMLTDILALARSGAGTETVEAYNPGQLLFAIGEDYRAMGKVVSGPEDVPSLPMMRGHAVLVRRALRNLIDNALAYGGNADVSVKRDGKGVRFIVRDDGPGVDPARLAELVEPFARGESSRNRATGGAGLGLAIVRDIAEAEGGALTIANRTDASGLEAVLALPAAAQQ